MAVLYGDRPHPNWLNGLSRPMLRELVGRRLFSGIDPDLIIAATGAPGDGDAWERLRGRSGRLKDVFSSGPESKKSLLPLLYMAAQRAGQVLDMDSSTYLRTAFLREERRIAAYRKISNVILSNIADSGRNCLVVGGSALADTLYAVPHERHSHDIHLLFPSISERAASIRALIEGGVKLASAGSRDDKSGGSDSRIVRLSHESGLTLHCQTELFDSRFHSIDDDALWARSLPGKIDGAESRRLSPADMLLQIVSDAGLKNHAASYLWPCDSYLLCRAEPAIDWRLLVEVAESANLAVPLYLGLGGLRNVLDAAVPDWVLERLSALAVSDRTFRDGEFLQLRRRRHWGPLRLISEMRGLGDRWDALAHVIWPSTGYLRQVYGEACRFPRISRVMGFFRGGAVRTLRKVGILAPLK